MKRSGALLLLVAVGGCDVLGLASPTTVVQGAVHEDGRPVPDVPVGVVVAYGFGPYTGGIGLAAFDTTGSDGRYSISAEWEGDGCGHFGVDIPASAKRALRLTALDQLTELPIECGEVNAGKDFRFTRSLWYAGVDLGPDTVLVEVGDIVELGGRFLVTSTPTHGALHRDSTDWVWDGAPDWEWEVVESTTRYVDRTWDGYYSASPPPESMVLQPTSPGEAHIVLRIRGSPFADSVLVVVGDTASTS